jgi:hypothetical protein
MFTYSIAEKRQTGSAYLGECRIYSPKDANGGERGQIPNNSHGLQCIGTFRSRHYVRKNALARSI